MEGNEKEKKHNQDAQTGDREMAGTEVGETPSRYHEEQDS